MLILLSGVDWSQPPLMMIGGSLAARWYIVGLVSLMTVLLPVCSAAGFSAAGHDDGRVYLVREFHCHCRSPFGVRENLFRVGES